MSTPGGKVSVFTGYGTGKTQGTAGAVRRKEAKPPARRRGEKRQIPARQAPWGGNRRQRSEYPLGPAGRAAEAGSTSTQSRKENRKAPKKKAPWEKRGAKKKRRRAGERAEKQIRCIQNKEPSACKAKLRPRNFHNIRGRTQRQVCAAGRIQNPHGGRPDAKCRDLPKERRQTHKRRVYAQSLPCKINPTAFQHKRHAYCAGLVLRNKSSGLPAQAPRILRRIRAQVLYRGKQDGRGTYRKTTACIHGRRATQPIRRNHRRIGERPKRTVFTVPLAFSAQVWHNSKKAVALRARLSLCLRKEMPCVMLTEPIHCVIG